MRPGLALIFVLGSVSVSHAGGDAKTCARMYEAMLATYKYCPEKGPARDANKFYAECMKTDYKTNMKYWDEWSKEAQSCKAHADAKAGDCEGFVDRMMSIREEARQNNCAFLKSGGWDASESRYRDQCMAGASKKGMQGNEKTFRRLLSECKAGSGGGGDNGGSGDTVKVNAEVTMYDTYKKSKKDLCYLEPGDKLTSLSPDGAKAPWRHLKGKTGDCKGQSGYVYDDGELE